MPRHKQLLIDENGRECRHCKTYKTWDNYRKLKLGINGRTSRCKQCMGSANPTGRPADRPSVLINDVDPTWDGLLASRFLSSNIGNLQ